MINEDQARAVGASVRIEPLLQTLNAQVGRFNTGEAQKTALRLYEELRKVNPGSLAQSVRDFVDLTDAPFHMHTVYKRLQINDRDGMQNVWAALNRLVDKGVLRKVRGKEGVYKKIDSDLEEMEWWEADTTPVDITLPLEINEICNIYPRNMIVVAGTYNTGKSGFAIRTAIMNMDKHNVRFFNSETSPNQFHTRLLQDQDINVEQFRDKVRVYDRLDAFDEVIDPDGFNIIDYLEVSDYIQVPNIMREIYRNLDKGIVLMNIQKDHKATWGHGGQKANQKPALYVTLDWGMARLLKVKDPKDYVNHPQGYIREFHLTKGSVFTGEGIWHPKADLGKPDVYAK